MTAVIDAVGTLRHNVPKQVAPYVLEVGKSAMFAANYLTAGEDGRKELKPGMIVALNSDGWYVPYNDAASYGTYSDTPVGVVHIYQDCTHQSPVIAPVVRGSVIERYCYVFGGNLGNIPDAVKNATEMRLIRWM